MGGRGSFSGLGKTIDEVLGLESTNGKAQELEVSGFGTLDETENHIRKKKKEVLVVFDKKGKAIKAYQGDEVSVAFPVEEAKKWKGLTVTHNHPKNWGEFGGTFSFEDIRNTTVYKFGSHRAVGCGQGEKNYILKATKKARPMAFNRRVAEDIPWLREKMYETVNRIKQDYINNKQNYKNYGHALHIARQKSVGMLNSYYREVAEQYGYIYRTQK